MPRQAAIMGVKIIWNAIRKLTNDKNRGSISQKDIVSNLIESGHFVDGKASIVVNNAVNDGLIIQSENGLLQLPSNNWRTNYEENEPDWYCYECHSGGDVVKCENCPRVFHAACIVSDAEKQALWDKLDYHRNNDKNKTLLKYVEPNLQEIYETDDASQSKNKAISIGSNLRRFCYGCRIIHKARMVQKNNMSQAELNYLLTFVFNRVHSWVNPDTFSQQDDTMPKADYIIDNINLSISNLLRFPTTIKMLEIKLANQEYTLLDEILRDILDIGHNLALVFGRHSVEFEATNYLFADALFEIGEIKTCHDCYRHSNEQFDTSWFTIPCASRKHELVYAKTAGFGFWPAKVVKINPDGKYDVRFFGKEHSRALVAPPNIESIDKNITRLNGKMSAGLRQSMNEMAEYQKRLNEPISLFTFEAEEKTREKNTSKYVPVPVDKTQNAKRSCSVSPVNQSAVKVRSKTVVNKRSRTQGPKLLQAKPSIEESFAKPVIENNIRKVSPELRPAPKRVKLERERKLNEEAQKSISPSVSDTSMTNTPTDKKLRKHPAIIKLETRLPFAKSVQEAQQVAIAIMQEEIENFKKKREKMIANHQAEILETKDTEWCKVCYKSAIYYCCWNTSYCSKDCQRKHYYEGHKKTCKRSKDVSNSTQ